MTTNKSYLLNKIYKPKMTSNILKHINMYAFYNYSQQTMTTMTMMMIVVTYKRVYCVIS